MAETGTPRGTRSTAAPVVIAVDAMSGDNDPRAAVRGALEAVLGEEIRVLLVGDPARLQSESDGWRHVLADRGRGAIERLQSHVEIVPAGSVIAMDEHPAQAVRSKRDASVVVATRLVSEGRAQAAISAGNSGATLAAALLTLGRIRGVARPAIGAAFPTPTGSSFLLDVGANVDCKAAWLLQFGVMGDIYARLMMGVSDPRVGLLSNGEEAEKGSELVQEAHRLLSGARLRQRRPQNGGGGRRAPLRRDLPRSPEIADRQGRRRPVEAPPPSPARPGRLPQGGRGAPSGRRR
jgi:glycerol-3-phosphate acyltransferase PlsX